MLWTCRWYGRCAFHTVLLQTIVWTDWEELARRQHRYIFHTLVWLGAMIKFYFFFLQIPFFSHFVLCSLGYFLLGVLWSPFKKDYWSNPLLVLAPGIPFYGTKAAQMATWATNEEHPTGNCTEPQTIIGLSDGSGNLLPCTTWKRGRHDVWVLGLLLFFLFLFLIWQQRRWSSGGSNVSKTSRAVVIAMERKDWPSI